MKKLLLLSFACCIAVLSFAQAPRYAVLEHFTNTSCAPCAAQNPGFEANILKPNEANARHISYHPWWPGNTDPFYLYDVPTQTARTQYYAVTGVPDVVLNGNVKRGQPGAITQPDIDKITSSTSPIKIETSWVDNGATREITVKVTSVGDVPAGSYALHTVIIEKEVNTATPPGNNGEKHFPNVMRKMLPDVNGADFNVPAKGQSVEVKYTYTEDAKLQLDKLEVISFIQNKSSKEILNAGSTFDPTVSISARPDKVVKNIAATNTSDFDYAITNNSNKTESYSVTLTSDQPMDWSQKLVINGTEYASTANVDVAGGATQSIKVKVVPGATPFIATYTVSIGSATQVTVPKISSRTHVISGVTDFIMHNSAATGDGKKHPADWKSIFDDGFKAAAGVGHGHGTEAIYLQAIKDAALNGVKHIYFNAGWSFPSLTAELATEFTKFAEAGGNIMISGQDVAWSTFDPDISVNTYSSPEAQEFSRTLMGVDYVDDGTSALNRLYPVASDPLYGTVALSNITAFYTSTYFFPDRLKVSGTGVPVFYYTTTPNPNSVAAIRNQSSKHKAFWLAPGVEQLSVAARTNILSITHKWFHGLISSTEFENEVAGLMLGQASPNPVKDVVSIPLTGSLTTNAVITVKDVTGTVIAENAVTGSNKVDFDVKSWPAGVYYYQIANNEGISRAMKFNVIK